MTIMLTIMLLSLTAIEFMRQQRPFAFAGASVSPDQVKAHKPRNVDKFQEMVNRGMISMKGGGKQPSGPSQADLDRQAEAERKAKEAEDAANEKVSASSRASYNSRTGRRLLLAPGREDTNATLGSNSGTSGGSF